MKYYWKLKMLGRYLISVISKKNYNLSVKTLSTLKTWWLKKYFSKAATLLQFDHVIEFNLRTSKFIGTLTVLPDVVTP